MKKVVPVLVGVVIGILIVFLGLRLTGRRIIKSDMKLTSLDPAMCEALAKISLKTDDQGNSEIVVDPDPVCLAFDRPLKWEVVGAGDVTITFKDQDVPQVGTFKGPFPTLANNANPQRGVYKGNSQAKIDSNKAEYTGRWEYSVGWQLPPLPDGSPGKIVKTKDPVVCIRD